MIGRDPVDAASNGCDGTDRSPNESGDRRDSAGWEAATSVQTRVAFTLRAWQDECLPLALDTLTAEPERRGVVSAVMGSGKSILIRELVRQWLADPDRAALGPVVVTTPTVKLVEQLGDTFTGDDGLGDVGLFYTHRKQHAARVVVCCNASARALATQWGPDVRAGLWVADEAHRSESAGLLEAAEAFRPHRRLAVTATPYRSEERERISQFDEVIYSYTPADALRDKVIVPWKIYGWEGGDTSVDDACVDLILAHHQVGPGIVNATSIDDAEAFARVLTGAGVSSQAIHSHLPRTEQAARLARLRSGDLGALVHVSLLTEGVDLPWLRWLCLRRPVGARVRFVQEVGRVLRADRDDPSKVEAILLDPHDLFSVFGLSYEAALGWYEEHVAEAAGQDETEEAGDGLREERRAVARGAVAAWVRQLLLALQAEGVALQSRVQGSGWRTLPPTEKQLGLVRKNAWVRRYLPTLHAEVLAVVAKRPDGLSRGVVSDLLSIEFALRERAESWSPEVDVPVPPPERVADATAELASDLEWRCGAALMAGRAAIAILQGNRVQYTGVRLARPGDSLETLTASARAKAAVDSGGGEARGYDPVATQLAVAEIRKAVWSRDT